MRTRICFFGGTLEDLRETMKSKFGDASKGCFASVFKTGRVAIKIFKRDRGYDDYLSFILANQGNPFVPKVFKVVVGQGFKMVVMELLEPITSEEQRVVYRKFHDMLLSRYSEQNLIEDENLLSVVNFIDSCKAHCSDISMRNVMLRKSGEFVITDTLC